MKVDGLTPKMQMFVKEYLVDLNATQAAIRAGYSAKRADAIGGENLRKPVIAAAIQKEMDNRSEKVTVSAQSVLESILRIGGKAEDADKYSEALKAQELLGKHLKLFVDVHEVKMDMNMAARFERAKAKAQVAIDG